MDIRKNYLAVCREIEKACSNSNRDPAEVSLVAVTKTFPAETVAAAIDAGIRIVGENRLQEAREKFDQIGNRVNWHFIGHLQTNKVKTAVRIFDVIESVDSIHLAREIDKQAQLLERQVNIFIQVNTSGEVSKFGIHPDNVSETITQIIDLQHINIMGLMTIAAFLPDAEQVRPSFTLLRDLRDRINQETGLNSLPYLSMGMSNDFQTAIEEGSTHVRLGRALFGERTKH